MTNGDMFPDAVNAVPPGATPSWFTDLGWFLGFEQDLLRERIIRRPFDLDPCGHADAPVSREILRRVGGRVWTIEDDGLSRGWGNSVVFCNPPYDAETLERWGAWWSLQQRFVAGIALLLPAWTDRGWWHKHIEPYRLSGALYVQFIEGRLPFGWPGNPDHIGADSAKFPSCTVTWRWHW